MRKIIVIFAAVCAALVLILIAVPSREKIGVIPIEGEILTAEDAVETIREMAHDDSLKSIILRLNSPGGTVAGSQEILEAVRELAQKKPVVASMGTVAASGAYYIACGATKILAAPGTITGSIGVRMEHVNIGDLLRFAKVHHETLKSGKYKDIGAFDRPLSVADRAFLQQLLHDMHDQFIDDVAASRHMDRKEVLTLADGRIFSGRQALELKLIDELGGFSQAIRRAAELGHMTGEPVLIYPKEKGWNWLGKILGESLNHVENFLNSYGSMRIPLARSEI
ncbi:MAG: signal peptide peptidase SppA [Deltaproteobacteria bacterium]|nr:signal peptide peptidase SppA [Deltaproteobacteria bacterium]